MAKGNSNKSTDYIKNASVLTLYLLVVWGLYRFIFDLPDEIEEYLIKPAIWLLPVIYYIGKEKLGISSLGFTLKNLFPSAYLAIGLGTLFVVEGLLVNYFKYGGFQFAANIGPDPLLISFILSFATAFTEETTFRGYIFNRVLMATKNEWFSNLSTSLVWGLIHVPIVIFVWKLDAISGIITIVLTIIFGIGSAFLFARTKNIFSSILLHVLWEWPIVLFR